MNGIKLRPNGMIGFGLAIVPRDRKASRTDDPSAWLVLIFPYRNLWIQIGGARQ